MNNYLYERCMNRLVEQKCFLYANVWRELAEKNKEYSEEVAEELWDTSGDVKKK
ncbi:MAG: hypothetical protein FWG87_02315 [Defluviitaleaceae bacterium]|nr:hypothetical protein [Defluviitaleaceae bacterium]